MTRLNIALILFLNTFYSQTELPTSSPGLLLSRREEALGTMLQKCISWVRVISWASFQFTRRKGGFLKENYRSTYMDKFSRGFNFAVGQKFGFRVDLISRLSPRVDLNSQPKGFKVILFFIYNLLLSFNNKRVPKNRNNQQRTWSQGYQHQVKSPWKSLAPKDIEVLLFKRPSLK